MFGVQIPGGFLEEEDCRGSAEPAWCTFPLLRPTSGHLPGTWELHGPGPNLLKLTAWHLTPLKASGGIRPARLGESLTPPPTGLSACQARADPTPARFSFCRPQEAKSRAKVIVGVTYLSGGAGTQSHRLFNAALFVIIKDWNQPPQVHQPGTRSRYFGRTT